MNLCYITGIFSVSKVSDILFFFTDFQRASHADKPGRTGSISFRRKYINIIELSIQFKNSIQVFYVLFFRNSTQFRKIVPYRATGHVGSFYSKDRFCIPICPGDASVFIIRHNSEILVIQNGLKRMP